MIFDYNETSFSFIFIFDLSYKYLLGLLKKECEALDNVDNYLWTWNKFSPPCEENSELLDGKCLEIGKSCI